MRALLLPPPPPHSGAAARSPAGACGTSKLPIEHGFQALRRLTACSLPIKCSAPPGHTQMARYLAEAICKLAAPPLQPSFIRVQVDQGERQHR